jgi:hypothetical protein
MMWLDHRITLTSGLDFATLHYHIVIQEILGSLWSALHLFRLLNIAKLSNQVTLVVFVDWSLPANKLTCTDPDAGQ